MMHQDLTTATNHLADILQQENVALSALDLAAAAAFVAEKRAAMEAFIAAQTADAPDAQKMQVETAMRLKALAQENRMLLARAIAVQSRVIGIVARAIPYDPNPLYAATGAVTRTGRPVAMTLSARA